MTFGSRVWFWGSAHLMMQLPNVKNPRWWLTLDSWCVPRVLHTSTAVARNPCVSWTFLFYTLMLLWLMSSSWFYSFVVVGFCIQVWEYSWHDDSVLDQGLLIRQTSSRESRGKSAPSVPVCCLYCDTVLWNHTPLTSFAHCLWHLHVM